MAPKASRIPGQAPGVAKLALRALGALGTVFADLTFGGASPLLAADPQTAVLDSPCGSPASLEDCRLSLLARQALFSEPALADLPLGVSVRANVARLWGAAPTAALVGLAQQRVREVTGVMEVRSEIRVDPKIEEARESLPSVLSVPILSGTLHASKGDPARQPIIAQFADKPSPSLASAPAQPARRMMSGPVVIMPPIALTSAGHSAPVAPSTDIPRSDASSPGAELKAAVDRLRRQDPTLHGVRAEFQGQVVMLSGTVSSWETLLELARSISRLPGVERVILDKINTSNDHSLAMP